MYGTGELNFADFESGVGVGFENVGLGLTHDGSVADVVADAEVSKYIFVESSA